MMMNPTNYDVWDALIFKKIDRNPFEGSDFQLFRELAQNAFYLLTTGAQAQINNLNRLHAIYGDGEYNNFLRQTLNYLWRRTPPVDQAWCDLYKKWHSHMGQRGRVWLSDEGYVCRFFGGNDKYEPYARDPSGNMISFGFFSPDEAAKVVIHGTPYLKKGDMFLMECPDCRGSGIVKIERCSCRLAGLGGDRETWYEDRDCTCHDGVIEKHAAIHEA